MRRKYFFTVGEYAREKHICPRHVRRLVKEGKISAQKVGRNYQILADQSKKPRVRWHYSPLGVRVPILPIAPEGLHWDMSKRCFVPIEKYAKEHGLRLVTRNGKKLLDMTSGPRFREELDKLLVKELQRSQWATLDSGEQILVLL